MRSRLILTISLFIGFIQTIAAQFSNPSSHSVYAQFTHGNGSHDIYSASLTHINKRGFSITLQSTNESRNSKNLPADYEPGWSIMGDGIPDVLISTKSLLVGKVFEEKSKLLRFNLQGGICYGTIERPVNFVKQSRRSFFGTTSYYYDYELQKNRFIGLMLNPTMDIMISRMIGFSTGILANINHQTITMGAQFSLQVGFIRKSR